MDTLLIWQVIAMAVLLGSIPFTGLVAAIRKRRGIDTPPAPIDPPFVLAGLLNIAKTFVPVYIAVNRHFPIWVVALTALLAVASDIFPYWLMFKPQGRGLAAALGVVFGLSPAAGTGVMVVWLVTLILSDRLSLAALVASVSAPLWLLATRADAAIVWLGLAGCAYVIMVHSSNIANLLSGSEPRWRDGDQA